ncbi:hypothetical protein INT47_009682 [Mucor saturninus]|uniref:PiggyBac transposable element-derived protein domain-containing protein n=1 Tax=Mucor saturninus TaxID=64648 RepID=A0A8H7UU84_9FUNG|nr:hypothetical protein INT47_009682 [Mucor saturninus]
MPLANSNLAVNVLVSVHKRFINNQEVKDLLCNKYDWNTPLLSFKGKTIACSSVNGAVLYDIVLDEVPGITLTLKQGCLKYLGPIETSSPTRDGPLEDPAALVATEEDSEDEIQEEEETEDEDGEDLSEGWTPGEVAIDSRLCDDSYQQQNARLSLANPGSASPLDYFLFFLPLNYFHQIIANINTNARDLTNNLWSDLTFNEYLMWIALLTVMTVLKHSDRKAYWKQGSSHFMMNIDFSQYMSYKRFNDIMRMHVFEVYSVEKQKVDPLYQIRSAIEAFNDHMATCVTPGKYLVVDESMNQWLGAGMPNLKNVPRKPHPIGQEFKTLADHHTYCILRMDTVSDPKVKEFDDEPGMKKLTATMKRLVKPWFGSGRTVIADSWFGSPAMTTMLSDLGLYSIMQVAKRRYWPRGMPTTDIVETVGEERGSHYTMRKVSSSGKLFVCAYRDQKVKAFVSSCSTTRLTSERTFLGSGGSLVAIKRPEVVDEYETHKSAVDAANNLRDNMISYHDIISTERWEMRFLGFFLGICEANAFSSFRVFGNGGSTSHSTFKDTLAWTLLKHCKELVHGTEPNLDDQRVLRSDTSHLYVSMRGMNGKKRMRLGCKNCQILGARRTRVEKSCSCDPTTPMCKTCYNDHLRTTWVTQTHLNNSL